MAKAQRTSRKLQEAIMHEVRRHPEWNRAIDDQMERASIRAACAFSDGDQ
jgi:hypothetical protein